MCDVLTQRVSAKVDGLAGAHKAAQARPWERASLLLEPVAGPVPPAQEGRPAPWEVAEVARFRSVLPVVRRPARIAVVPLAWVGGARLLPGQAALRT